MLLGPDGVASRADPDTLVVDGSTIGPDASRRMATRLREHRLRYVDAPVYGSVGAGHRGHPRRAGRRRETDVAAARPLLELWGDPKKRHVGPVGAGSAAKLVRNLTLGLALAGIGDALRLAATLDLPPDVVDELIAAGPLGAAFPPVREILAAGPPETAGFTVDMLTKDLRLCLAAEPRLPLVDAAREVGEAAHAAGHGQDDTRALPVWRRDASYRTGRPPVRTAGGPVRPGSCGTPRPATRRRAGTAPRWRGAAGRRGASPRRAAGSRCG